MSLRQSNAEPIPFTIPSEDATTRWFMQAITSTISSSFTVLAVAAVLFANAYAIPLLHGALLKMSSVPVLLAHAVAIILVWYTASRLHHLLLTMSAAAIQSGGPITLGVLHRSMKHRDNLPNSFTILNTKPLPFVLILITLLAVASPNISIGNAFLFDKPAILCFLLSVQASFSTLKYASPEVLLVSKHADHPTFIATDRAMKTNGKVPHAAGLLASAFAAALVSNVAAFGYIFGASNAGWIALLAAPIAAFLASAFNNDVFPSLTTN